MKRKNDEPEPVLNGETLVGEFVSAMTNLSTAETAKYVAEQTERQAVETFRSIGSHENPLLSELGALTPALQADLVRSSLDAHLQKAQSEQISTFARQQLAQAEADALQNYKGCKVRIEIVDKEFKPVESYWWDKRTGRYRQGIVKSGRINGRIDDLSLGNNVLIIKPSFKSRVFLPDRKYFAVYVVNPQTLLAAVKITLL